MSLSATGPVWDDGAWVPMPALERELAVEWCVVGLGGSGLTAMLALLEHGVPAAHMCGIDAHDVGAGAAGRNGGFLLAGAYDFYHDAVRKHGRDRARAIYEATRGEIARIAREAPGTVRFVGSRRLAAGPEEVDDCREQHEVMQHDGLAVEWRSDGDGEGLYLPEDASFNPLARCRVLASRLREAGVAMFSRTPVVSFDGTHVVTPHGVVRAERVLVAVDGKLELLLPELATRVRTARLQMLATASTDERVVVCPMYYREGYEYWQQTASGAIAIGGFRDQAGESEWTVDGTPTESVQARLEAFVREYLGVQAPITHRWTGHTAFSRTGLPVIDEVRPGVFAIGGYSGTGNVVGALAARAVVRWQCAGDRALRELLAS